MSVGQIALVCLRNNLQLLANEVHLHLQFWQNLLSKLVGFPLDGGSNWGSSVSTSITTMSATNSVADSSVVVSSVKKVWETEEKRDEEEEWESYEDKTGGDIIAPAPSTTVSSLPCGSPVAGRIRHFSMLLGSCSGQSNKAKSNNTDHCLHIENF
jgi:hypothetical protein